MAPMPTELQPVKVEQAQLPPAPDWVCEAVALIAPVSTYISSGALGVPLPAWVPPVLAIITYAASRWLLMCTPTQVLARRKTLQTQ